MKKYSLLLGLIIILGLFSCSNSSPDSNEIATEELLSTHVLTDSGKETSTLSVEVGRFTTDELFEAGGGGCGMSLWKPETNPQKDGLLFFHGLEDAMSFMVFDGKMAKLNRTNSSGEDFYGQKTDQTFITEDNKITVEVKITPGAAGEIESVSIPSGTITVITEGQTQELPVVGDAGC
ncbi:MAG: hypothetical protein AB4206_14920 [Xenococcaceae cyanobacterium]